MFIYVHIGVLIYSKVYLDLPTINDVCIFASFANSDIDGKEVSLEKYRGHVCVIVNVASR